MEDVRVVSRGGAKLHEMMDEAERARDPGTTLFLFGVPDLWVRGHGRMDRAKVRPLEETIARARGRREWVLGPIFPPKDASQGEISTIHCINAQIPHLWYHVKYLISPCIMSLYSIVVIGSLSASFLLGVSYSNGRFSPPMSHSSFL